MVQGASVQGAGPPLKTLGFWNGDSCQPWQGLGRKRPFSRAIGGACGTLGAGLA